MAEERIRVLLLDDEESLRVPLKKHLERNFGYHVDAVGSGEEALAQVERAQGRYDVALLDEVLVRPPDGIEVMEQVKARYPNIECIIFTGWGAQPRERALRAGAFRYVEKPFNVDELAMLIRTAAQQVRLREIGRAILLPRTQEQVLGSIADAACSLALADEAAIVLEHPATGRLRLHAKTYTDQEQWRRHFQDRELSKEIIASGRTTGVSDTRDDAHVNPALRDAGIRSFIGVPIPAEKGNLGVLYVYSRQPGRFDEGATVAVLQTLAGQAGLAIANAQAFEQIQAHAEHMGALVRAGQSPTRTTELDRQLALAWDFVREQLKVSTFFVALYDRETDILRFPLYYDEGEPVARPDRYLGDDQERWGLAGYVVKTGQELYWPTDEDKQRDCCEAGIKPQRVNKACQSCFFLPLKIGDEIIGVMSLQSYDRHAFSPIILDVCRALGSQLSVALENVRLFEEVDRRASNLETLQDLALAIGSSLDLDETLKRGCQAAVQFFKADHSGLVLFDPDYTQGWVRAEYPARGTLRAIIPVRGIPAEERLVKSKEPLVIYKIADEESLGTVRDILLRFGIQSILIVPVIGKDGTLLGSFSLDAVDDLRQFTKEEIELCKVFAAHVAVAIENASLYSRLRETKEQLDALIESSLDAVVAIDPKKRITVFNRQAEEMFGRSKKEMLGQTVIPLYGDQEKAREIFKAVNREGAITGRNVDLKHRDGTLIPTLLSATLLRDSQGNPIGQAGFMRDLREVKSLEAQLQALIAQVERTREAAKTIASVTVQENLAETLKTIAQHTQRVLRSDAVVLYSYDKVTERFSKWATEILDPRDPDAARPPSKLTPDSAPWGIFNISKPPYHYFVEDNASRDELLGGRFVNAEGIRAAIGIQLRVGDRTVGVMFVNFRSAHRFTGDEIATIRLFADQAAVAIRNAQLYGELKGRMDTLQALYDAGQAITGALTLQEVLDRIVMQARHLVGESDEEGCFSRLALVEGHVLHFAAACAPEILAGLRETVGDIDLEHSPRIGITGRAVKERRTQNVGDVQTDPDYIRFDSRTRSELAVPIRFGQQVIGVINIEHPWLHAFSRDDEQALESLAAQAAIAIRNVRQNELQRAVYEASKIIAAGIAVERRELLKRILEQAATRICWPQQPKAHLAVIQLYDSKAQALSLESVYPPDQFLRLIEKIGERQHLDLARVSRIGIAGRTVLTGNIQRVDDVRKDPDYVAFHPATLSELDVPLRMGDRILGVLSLESDRLGAFDEMDEATLQSLTDLAAIVIENARQYEELRRAKGLVGARTALAWMGMASSAWRHDIDKHAVTIRDLCQLLRMEIQKPSPRLPYIQGKLDAIERLATQTLKRPIVPPLSREEVGEPVALNDLVGERARQLWQNDPYRKAQLRLDLQLPASAAVWASPEWLRQAFDVLVDNAVEAVADREVREIVIGAHAANEGAEIRVSDTGPGIPEEIQAKIGLKAIEKPEDAKGLGMGLLIAQTIVETYGGELRVAATGPTGTTMVIWLPLIQQEEPAHVN